MNRTYQKCYWRFDTALIAALLFKQFCADPLDVRKIFAEPVRNTSAAFAVKFEMQRVVFLIGMIAKQRP